MVRPLEHVKIVVTRPPARANDLAEPLRAAGADVVLAPLVRIEPTHAPIPAIDELDWIVFTSANGVEQFFSRVAWVAASIACVGPATAAAVRAHGHAVALVPEAFTGSAVADAIAAREALAGKRVLLARAGGAGTDLPTKLAEAGALVHDVELYVSVPNYDAVQTVTNAQADVITFTSGSAVRYFIEGGGRLNDARVAVIGPVTAEVARAHGMSVDMTADPHTIEGLVTAIMEYFGGTR